ncbi:dimethylsulfonioproprionate lyase family protein [Amphritea sp.]|uniref:dimethylsulfonioproprionate lyase family protein n=1 Tax=Amphritea sp. TaxID=1872502 RepID=UPI003A8CF831
MESGDVVAVLHDIRTQLRGLLKTTELAGPELKAAEVIRQRLAEQGVLSLPSMQISPQVELYDLRHQLGATIPQLPPQLRSLAQACFSLADLLFWFQRSSPQHPDFMAGHINAEIIGPRGLERRDDITVGISLMRPGLTYPDHHHLPEEIYLVLSHGLWRQADDFWWSPGIGGYVYNPSHIVHAMRSVDTPLLALWCLKH